jgi:hypothetical protein
MGEHKLAGTVVLFGQQDVGMLASKFERQSPDWNTEERELRVTDVATHLPKSVREICATRAIRTPDNRGHSHSAAAEF